MDFDATAHPDKLNLGCGFDLRPGYLNVDFQAFHEPDLVADVTRLAMLPDDRYVEVLAQDVLEHLPRTETQAVLGEWNRLMAEGGILELRVPSLTDLLRRFEDPAQQTPEAQEQLLQQLFGTQAYTGDVHLTSFTRPLLAHYLREEGFRVETWELHDDWLFTVRARKVGPSAYRAEYGRFEDLLTEADAGAFIDGAYEMVFGRTPDPHGRAYYLEQLEGGVLGRRRLLRILLDSDEAAGKAG